MSDVRSNALPTIPIAAARGNALFERAVAAIGLDEATTRWLAFSTLNTIGAAPLELTPDELGNLLPEFNRRLRKLLPDENAEAAVRRLQRVLFEQAESI